ncbi:hypothetical protein OKW09_005250, partial [Pseudomonas rhodesiae]|nr:hypothetical protein [Pseudomonas rhodesiae]
MGQPQHTRRLLCESLMLGKEQHSGMSGDEAVFR